MRSLIQLHDLGYCSTQYILLDRGQEKIWEAEETAGKGAGRAKKLPTRLRHMSKQLRSETFMCTPLFSWTGTQSSLHYSLLHFISGQPCEDVLQITVVKELFKKASDLSRQVWEQELHPVAAFLHTHLPWRKSYYTQWDLIPNRFAWEGFCQ